MSAIIEPIIDKGYVFTTYLKSTDPRGPFPSKLYVHAMCHDDPALLYVPRINAYTIVIMGDDDNIIGHCECSNCHDNVNLFDTYCSHCGARLIGRKVSGEDLCE